MENVLIFASEKEVRFTKLLKFIVPTYLTSLFNTVYTIIDGIFVSTYVGTNALASINIVYPIVNVLTGIALVFATGGIVKVNVKEIRFGPQTDDHDYNFKLKHAKGFLEDGDKVKAYVFFKGRSILFKEQGEVLLLRFANDLEDYAKVDQMPVLEGKRMTIQLSPKKKEAPKKPVVAKPAAPAQKAEMPKTDAE